jgi:hypothetical protein
MIKFVVQMPPQMDGSPTQGAGELALSERARSAFCPVTRLVEGEAPMQRIEMIVLVGLYALLTPLIITLALR